MSPSLRLAAAFFVVYVVWGSTYLAIRIGVHDLPPALMTGVRYAAAGLILTLLARVLGQRFPGRRSDWVPVAVMGFCMIVVGNFFVTWGEQWVASNQAALIAASSALWIALFGSFGRHAHRLSARSMLGLGVGFCGVALMFWPEESFDATHLLAQGGILLAVLGWATGTTYNRNNPVEIEPLMFAGLQMLAGGSALIVAGLASGEAQRWTWTFSGIAALTYLTLFGSCLAFATYVWLIRHTTPDKLGTIGYVNPAIATVLGWWWLDEALGPRKFAGMLVILLGVVLVSIPARRPRSIWRRMP
ncbi:MAG: EamA family transporter [Gammaproteobacteria bacterium]